MTDDFVPTKEEPGPFDGMENAKPGEPVFTLQGGDPLSAPLVQLWADAARVRAGSGTLDASSFAKLAQVATTDQAGKHKREELLLRATEAEGIGWAMDAYRKAEQVVERVTESYSGHVQSEESKAEAKRQQGLHDLAQRLEEAKYHANETADALDAMEGFHDLAEMLRATVGQLDAVAVAIRPKRAAMPVDAQVRPAMEPEVALRDRWPVEGGFAWFERAQTMLDHIESAAKESPFTSEAVQLAFVELAAAVHVELTAVRVAQQERHNAS